MKFIWAFGMIFSSLFILNNEPTKEMNYNQAIELAKNNNKMIMLKLTADHCKYCIKMDNEVLADKEVKNVLSQNFITVNINVDKEALPLGLKRTITPTFIFVDKEGKIVSKIPGSWNKKDFMELLFARIKH